MYVCVRALEQASERAREKERDRERARERVREVILSIYKYANMYIENMNRETQAHRDNEENEKQTHTHTMPKYILHTYHCLGASEAHCST